MCFQLYNNMNKSIRKLSQFTQGLHCLMLILCAFASLALFLTQSLVYKLILAFLLLAYAAFLARHPQLTSFLLRAQPAQIRTDHVKVHQWQPSTSTHRHSDTSLLSGDKKRTYEKGVDQDVSMVSAQRSMLREESFSSFRGLSTSYLNDSHISSSKRRILETRGTDISNLFIDRSETKPLGKSSGISQRPMQIMDRKAIARKRLQAQRSESQRGYEEQLAELKKSSKYVQGRYQRVLNSIHSHINPLFNEHRNNTSKLIEISQQFLDIVLDDKATVGAQQNIKKIQGSTLRLSFPALLQRLLSAYVKLEPLQLTKLPLRANKKWNDLQKKVNQLIRARIRLAQSLGVSTQGLSSNVRRGVVPFLEQYSNYVGLLETFVGADLTKKAYQAQIDELSEESMLREFKSRIYVLYLYVRYMNTLIKGTPKICLKDYLGFKSNVTEGEIEISPKYTFDAYVPYYNLWVTEGGVIKCYPCEYGPANYLSLIYFLMLTLSKRVEMKQRPEVARIINQIV